MTDSEIQKYIKKAKYVATNCGYPELADDFSQEMFVEFLQNPDRGATVNQLFIDYLRRTHGRPGTPGGDARIFARRHTISIDFWNEEESRIQIPSPTSIGNLEHDSRSDFDLGRLSFLFRGREAEIYQLHFVEEMTQRAIGKVFGISESRVNQLLRSIKKEIEDYCLMKEMRERLEWDDSYLKLYKINWIQL